MTIWDCRTHVPMTSSVERTDLDFKISVALVCTVCPSLSVRKLRIITVVSISVRVMMFYVTHAMLQFYFVQHWNSWIITITLFQEDNITGMTYSTQLRSKHVTDKWMSINYWQYVQSGWGLRTPRVLPEKYCKLLSFLIIQGIQLNKWHPSKVTF